MRRKRVRTHLCAALALVGVMFVPIHGAAGASVDEIRAAQIKAACLYHLTHMLTWPADRFADTNTPLRVAFVGTDEHGLVAFFSQSLKTAPALVKRIELLRFERPPEAPEALNRCHLVFFLGRAGDKSASLLEALATAGVVTVGESDTFLKARGTIAFLVKRQRLGIWVDKVRLESTKVTTSAEFLQHAVFVRDRKTLPDKPNKLSDPKGAAS
ncbi:MAG: YfiR family protein [Verrucomicrobia bacterium]|nr:YfiR family protein [Verrucomicrobiota bacterium]MBT7701190.1 YfiR family protein [Verrucomicrobiota bacterium]